MKIYGLYSELLKEGYIGDSVGECCSYEGGYQGLRL